MTKSKFDSLTIGLTTGLLLPLMTMLLFFTSKCGSYSIKDCIAYSSFQHVLPQILSLCVLPNLGLFFLFIWRNHNTSAKGVLWATMFCALFVLGVKIFI